MESIFMPTSLGHVRSRTQFRVPDHIQIGEPGAPNALLMPRPPALSASRKTSVVGISS